MTTNTYNFFDVIFSDGSVIGFSSVESALTYAALASLYIVAISNAITHSISITELD